MSVEREIELSGQKGTLVNWQAYGLNGIELQVPPTVYPPRQDTSLLDRVIAELGPGQGRHLLEIGCGSGAIAISSAMRGWKVSACDINPLAIAATRGNASNHGLELDANVREGGPGDIDLWQPKEGADVIVWNLPYIEPQEGERLGPMEDSALIGTNESSELLDTITSNPKMLNRGGIILMLHSSNQIGLNLTRDWRQAGCATRNTRQKKIGDECLTVVACWRPFESAQIRRVENCDSTNDELLNEEGGVQGTFLSTEKQVLGRGYAGRDWINSQDGFMGSWLLSENSINRGSEYLQLAANVAVLDTFSTALKRGLPSHTWVNGSSLEEMGFRVKWPNDIWLRSESKFGKLCGILIEGRTRGDDVRIVLGIGINRYDVEKFEKSIGWDRLYPGDFDDIQPIIHASIASLLEVHPMVDDVSYNDILNSIYSVMRCTCSEGVPRAFGLDENGGLKTTQGVVRSTGEIEWEWS
ncbi:MAG: 50S ribosomal protein L11 methyltransferase [Candidatus Thermoplasmatota archaeon]|nr:50S ribosomal protein L11 methyltransferase [Candidatus Thermoplasmatota archaeon]